MKKINFLGLLIALFSTFCSGQKKINENYLQVNPLRYINKKYVSLTTFLNSDETRKMYIPYYEFNLNNIKIGEACLFGISKTYPEKWIKEAARKECSENRNAFQAIACYSEIMFTTDTTILKKELDLYFFMVDKKELENPIVEEAEGGTVKSYHPKKGSTYHIYKYENDKWKEIDKIIPNESEIPRNFGMEYIEKITVKMME